MFFRKKNYSNERNQRNEMFLLLLMWEENKNEPNPSVKLYDVLEPGVMTIISTIRVEYLFIYLTCHWIHNVTWLPDESYFLSSSTLPTFSN